MLQPGQPANDFLTPEEAADVDGALLASRDKFTTRVAIYSLRVLKTIGEKQGVAIATISNQQISDWIDQDDTVAQSTIEGLETNTSFKQFFSRLVLSSLKPLRQIAAENDVPLEALSSKQVIAWFEKEAKQRIEKESEASS